MHRFHISPARRPIRRGTLSWPALNDPCHLQLHPTTSIGSPVDLFPFPPLGLHHMDGPLRADNNSPFRTAVTHRERGIPNLGAISQRGEEGERGILMQVPAEGDKKWEMLASRRGNRVTFGRWSRDGTGVEMLTVTVVTRGGFLGEQMDGSKHGKMGNPWNDSTPGPAQQVSLQMTASTLRANWRIGSSISVRTQVRHTAELQQPLYTLVAPLYRRSCSLPPILSSAFSVVVSPQAQCVSTVAPGDTGSIYREYRPSASAQHHASWHS